MSENNAQDALAQCAVTRALLESVIANLPNDQALEVLLAFEDQCEELRAQLLASPASELLIEAVDRAILLQWRRLRASGLAPQHTIGPPEADGDPPAP